MEVCNKANEVGGKQKRNWCCVRCDEPINIFVPDNERKFIIDGDKIFCGPTCKSAYKQFIPKDLARKKISQLKKVGPKDSKSKSKPLYKCFKCDNTTHYLTWDRLCTICRDKDEYSGSLTAAQKTEIRLYQIVK